MSAVADQFGLEQWVERLGHRVVAVALAPNGRDGASFGETFGVADCDVLHAAVGVVDQSRGVVAVVRRVHKPMFRASKARSVRSEVESCQPTPPRLKTSKTKAAYTQPGKVRT